MKKMLSWLHNLILGPKSVHQSKTYRIGQYVIVAGNGTGFLFTVPILIDLLWYTTEPSRFLIFGDVFAVMVVVTGILISVANYVPEHPKVASSKG